MMLPPFQVIIDESSGIEVLTEPQDLHETAIYEVMKECLINLVLINPDGTIAAFQAYFDDLVKNFNRVHFCKLCWCVCAISKVIDNSEKEEKFVTKILNTLLGIEKVNTI